LVIWPWALVIEDIRNEQTINQLNAPIATMPQSKCLVSWSSGKDSAWMVHVLRQQPDIELAGILTTINEKYSRVAMHAVREELLEAQADPLGLLLWKVPIPSPCPH